MAGFISKNLAPLIGWFSNGSAQISTNQNENRI